MDPFPFFNLSTNSTLRVPVSLLQSAISLTMLLSNIILSIFPFVTASSTSPDLPVVTSTSGTFRGYYPDKTVCAFLGIPFSKPSVGDLRFEAPRVLVSKSKTVIDATMFGKTCSQFRYKTIGFKKHGPTTEEPEAC